MTSEVAMPHPIEAPNPVTPFNDSMKRYHDLPDSPSSGMDKAEHTALDSPSSSERSSTPSSTTSTSATSILDATDLAKSSTSISSTPVTANSPAPDASITAPTSESTSTATAILPIPTSPSSKKDKKDKEKEKDKAKEKKASKSANRAAATASGISTTVPIQAERPRPSAHSTLDDDVLFAIFEILFDHDPKTEGMTVKQICDILTEKHPEMAKLSSKTSNLVSAKLNAYVKRVEKGEKTIVYALSRDWADASPKRMVYVYRGLLTKDYYLYVQKVLETQKALEAANSPMDGVERIDTGAEDTKDSKKQKKSAKSATPLADTNAMQGLSFSNPSEGVSPAGLDLTNTTPFIDAPLDLRIPQLSIPYSAAPVTASLNMGSFDNSSPQSASRQQSAPVSSSGLNSASFKSSKTNDSTISPKSVKEDRNSQWLSALHDSESDDEESDVYDTLRPAFNEDEEENEIYSNNGYYRRGSMIVGHKIPSSIGKRSKSMSFINSKKPKTQHLTAAAATPRIPKNQSIANSPTAAAAVAALRAAALNTFNSPAESVSSITKSIMSDTSVEPSISMKWLETVRSGFLTEEVGTPEDISLAELDTLFT